MIAGLAEMAIDLGHQGVTVWNCSVASAIPYWPRMTFGDALDRLRAEGALSK